MICCIIALKVGKMFQMLSKNKPTLTFTHLEQISDGVFVKPIHFSLNKKLPPFKTTYFEVKPHCKTQTDQHQVEEMWIVLKGQGILNYEEQCYEINEHDILYFASFKKHQVYNKTSETLLICSLYW